MKFADNPMTGSLAIWCLGILLFFDDYANILIRGGTCESESCQILRLFVLPILNQMPFLCFWRCVPPVLPVSDQVNISHEKMAFLVHATSAPLAAIAPVSSWVGYQVGLVDTELTVRASQSWPSEVCIQEKPNLDTSLPCCAEPRYRRQCISRFP
jgi:hypothetical protein